MVDVALSRIKVISFPLANQLEDFLLTWCQCLIGRLKNVVEALT